MHIAFKKEYDELERFDLGKRIDIKSFVKYVDSNGKSCRVLDILVEKPKMIDEEYTYLYLREINGVSMPYITNERGSYINDNGYYNKFIRLDAKLVKKYLSLFEKYQLLFDLYSYLNNQVVYADGTNFLFTRIDSEDNSFLDNMDSFRVSLSTNHVLDSGDHINIKVNLDQELNIDLENSRIKLGDEDISINDEICLDILKRIYVNGKYLEKNTKRNNKDNSKVKMLVNNI